MNGTLRLDGTKTGGGLFGRGLLQMAGMIAGVCAVVVGAGLALVFAASLVVIGLMGAVLIAFAGLALRARSPVRVRTARGGQHLEARKVGHSWVAYGWDRG